MPRQLPSNASKAGHFVQPGHQRDFKQKKRANVSEVCWTSSFLGSIYKYKNIYIEKERERDKKTRKSFKKNMVSSCFSFKRQLIWLISSYDPFTLKINKNCRHEINRLIFSKQSQNQFFYQKKNLGYPGISTRWAATLLEVLCTGKTYACLRQIVHLISCFMLVDEEIPGFQGKGSGLNCLSYNGKVMK